MRTISGINAVDDLVAEGPIYIITHNEPRYVVMEKTRYEELVEGCQEGFAARIRAALADVAAGKFQRFESVSEFMN
jgi:PHD/YefM family antitoxin component YafN of YafNO toxin-antitoxin module